MQHNIQERVYFFLHLIYKRQHGLEPVNFEFDEFDKEHMDKNIKGLLGERDELKKLGLLPEPEGSCSVTSVTCGRN